jgi:hypothetical protein
MVKKKNKLKKSVPLQVSIQDMQDEIFKKMPIKKKLSLLDDFFRFGKKLQQLNNSV